MLTSGAARRRVSFAPEATLHTWDVIEYMRDATSSSASSNSTRRASNATQEASSPGRGVRFSGPDSDPTDPPSTPPEQVEDDLPSSSPEKQRDLHQKKRRRSSGIPPMNFNNPDDEFSSSPHSGGSTPGSDEVEMESDDDDGSTMMSLDEGDENEHTMASVASNDSTGSSARLDAALRQAREQAGTTRFRFDEEEEDGEASMEMAGDEITAAFKPWVQKTTSSEDKENVQPAPFAFKLPGPGDDDTDEGEEMSMDITRAIGGIVPSRQEDQQDSAEPDNLTMDFTTAFGSIQSGEPVEEPSRAGAKRRRSSALQATSDDQGSPAKRKSSRRMSIRKRKSTSQEGSLEEGTMDLTTAIGSIRPAQPQDETARRESINSTFGDETMDFTMVMGGIKHDAQEPSMDDDTVMSKDGNEDLSMEFTAILGSIQNKQQDTTPATPQLKETTVATPPSKRGSAARFTNNHPEVPSPSPMKTSAAAVANTESPLPSFKIHKDTTPRKSPRRSPRKSITASKPEPVAEPEPTPATETLLPSSPPQNPAETTLPQPENIFQNALEQQASIPAEAKSTTPVEEPTPKKTQTLMDSIKLLSTPRKQVYMSPLKRSMTMTPKEPTPRKSPSPKKGPSPRKSASPRKQVQFGVDHEKSPAAPTVQESHDSAQDIAEEEREQEEQIKLHEFLELTKIRFMELTTTKRRHTGYPGAQNGFGRGTSMGAAEIEGKDDLETCVVAAACTEPEYLMYQHACHELKRYIAEGKNLVHQIEEETYEENPALFREYLSAPADQRQVMDNQFKNMKTNARLRTKEAWYGWRSNLLHDIKAALTKTASSFDEDDVALRKQEEVLESSMPALQELHGEMKADCRQLQRRAEELNGPDREELDAARERLVAAEAAIEEKKRMVEALQTELAEKEAGIAAAKERKVEFIEEIKAAERVREECRGWSVDEVNMLKARVSALESEHGWLITSASANPETVTMSYRNDLQLFFYPGAFAPHAASADSPNATISLTYIGDNKPANATPLTTTKRFFLQVLRANLHCLPQSTTAIRAVLAHVARGWDAALAVAENVRRLSLTHITEESILSDERMAVSTVMLLPSVQSKVRVNFEVAVAVDGVEQDMKTSVGTAARVMYGEQYKEAKMAEFLGQFVGGEVVVGGPARWGEAVADLKERLVARGKKGGRID